jgi:hypothetical protein
MLKEQQLHQPRRDMKDSFFIMRAVAAVMLFIAFADLPYAYYQALRWVVCGVTGYGAYMAYEGKNQTWAWAFGVTAILFNPIMPFYLERETWQLLDVAAAIMLFISLATFKQGQTK